MRAFRSFARPAPRSQRPATAKPAVEDLEARDLPSVLLWNPPNANATSWADTGNWEKDGNPNNHPNLPPQNTDQVVFGGTGFADNPCDHVSGTISNLTINSSYPSTITLSGTLTAGDAAHTNNLNGTTSTTINLAGNTLKLQGPVDNWGTCQVTGNGTLEVAGTLSINNAGRNSCFARLLNSSTP